MFSKKIAEQEDNFILEMDRLKYDCTKYKTKLEKSFFKKRVKKLMGLKTMAKLSTSNPDLRTNITVPYKVQIENARNGFKHLFNDAREKHLEKITKIYEDAYRTIRYLKEASINAV